MAKKTDNPPKGNSAAKKRNFIQNIKDSFTIVKRSFPWIPWAMLGTTLAAIAGNILYMILTKSWIFGTLTALMLLFLIPLLWLSLFLSKAMLRQIENTKGCVGALRQIIRRSWIAEEEPVAFNKEQDMIWRFVGPKGVVLVSEGPHSRVKRMLDDEVKKTARVVAQIPVHTIESGTEQEQVRLEKVMNTMYKFPKALTRVEIPAVQKRLRAIRRNEGMPIPKGVDPFKVKPDRRALYG